jgi:hypothetical protein
MHQCSNYFLRKIHQNFDMFRSILIISRQLFNINKALNSLKMVKVYRNMSEF